MTRIKPAAPLPGVSETVRALSVGQPVAAGLVRGLTRAVGKGWRPPYNGGPLLLHAAAVDTALLRRPAVRQGLAGGRRRVALHLERVALGQALPDPTLLPTGGYVATARLVSAHPAEGCRSCGPWVAPGDWHWALADVRGLPLVIPAASRPGLMPVEGAVRAAVEAVQAA